MMFTCSYITPKEGHNVLIEGTTYAITGGYALVGGTAYELKGGKTLVGGTVYEVALESKITVNITGSGSSLYSYVTINGTKYSSAATIECEPGTTITAVAHPTISSEYMARRTPISLRRPLWSDMVLRRRRL